MQEIDGKYYMVCPLCGPYNLCYEEYYDSDLVSPFAIRFISHQNMSAKISDLITVSDKDDYAIKFQVVKCYHCHSIVNVKQHISNIINSEEIICHS